MTSPGAFSEDIDAFSRALGEWIAEPLIISSSPCGPLEVGDPLETFSNYGTFAVNFNSVMWHPPALAFPQYFGAPPNFAADDWLDCRHCLGEACRNGR